MNARDIGERGENAACKFLKKQGFKILERNYQRAAGKILGEIDIIAKQGETLVFVEVKTRKTEEFGLPCEFVTPKKQQRMIRAAYTYTMEQKLDVPCRFDVVEVICDGKKINELRHIPHAFTL